MNATASDEVEDRIPIGPWTVTLSRPGDVDALLDEDAFARDELMPYWAELWPSGIALARHVATLDLRGRRVLELGCGLGLPSLAASLAGGEVTATDWSEDAVRLLRRNAAANGLRLRAETLRWDAPAALPPASFELVLAADVVYEARNHNVLLDLLERVLARSATALLADPGRRQLDAFLGLAGAGWELAALPDSVLPRGGIHVLRRR